MTTELDRKGQMGGSYAIQAQRLGALHIALGGLQGHMPIEAEPGVTVSAKTVGELRKVTSWPENLVITTPQERHPKSVVKVSKASVATHYPPRR